MQHCERCGGEMEYEHLACCCPHSPEQGWEIHVSRVDWQHGCELIMGTVSSDRTVVSGLPGVKPQAFGRALAEMILAEFSQQGWEGTLVPATGVKV